MTKRRKFSDQFKAKVALEALRGDRTIQPTLVQPLIPNQRLEIHGGKAGARHRCLNWLDGQKKGEEEV